MQTHAIPEKYLFFMFFFINPPQKIFGKPSLIRKNAILHPVSPEKLCKRIF